MSSQAEIHEMISSTKAEDRKDAASALVSALALLPDKTQGWQDLLRLTQDQDSDVRMIAARALGFAFSLQPDKDQRWQDLIRLSYDDKSIGQSEAIEVLGTVFGFVPNKDQAWRDLFNLANDDNRQSFIQMTAVIAMGKAFIQIPDERKDNAWHDLHNLTNHQEKGGVRWGAALAIGTAFCHLSEKYRHEALEDLHRLADPNEKTGVKWGVAEALGVVFSHITDEERSEALRDLLSFTRDVDSSVRMQAYYSLGRASFFNAQAWQMLHRLTQDRDDVLRRDVVRREVAKALGSIFSQVADRDQAWQDLYELTQDGDRDLRMYAYHSLGRASVFKATEAHDNDTLNKELKAAVAFFKKSSQEAKCSPANFCYLFYRSYLALAFQGASESEVKKYLAEAKEAVGGSENKKKLLSAVENLAKALEESQKLKEKSIKDIQCDLQAYRWYCDRAAEHMAAVEEKAPGAVGLLRKCNPIIEERIEATIAGIQKAAREICQVTRGSGKKYEEPGAQINREAKSLSSEDPIKAFKSSTRIASILRVFCGLLPRDKRGHACEIVDEIETEQDLSGRLSKIELALTYLQPNIDMAAHESATVNKLEEMHIDIKSMDKKLNTIILDLSKIKISSGDISANLCSVRTALYKIEEMERASAKDQKGVLTPPVHPSESQIELGNLIEARVSELEEILKCKATKEDIQAILNKLESLKPSAGFEWLGRIADLIAVFDASIKVFSFLM